MPQQRDLAGAPSAARGRLWHAMRMNRQFRIAELIALCAVRRKAAEKYLAALIKGGYVRVEERKRGCKGSVYTLIRNSGPFPPRAGRGAAVFDPNDAITSERARHADLIAQIRSSERRLAALGAFVEAAQCRAD